MQKDNSRSELGGRWRHGDDAATIELFNKKHPGFNLTKYSFRLWRLGNGSKFGHLFLECFNELKGIKNTTNDTPSQQSANY